MATPMANPTAAERFLAVNELLEQVFLFIPPGRLLHSVQLVSRHFREVIHDTQSLREHHWVAFSTGNRIQPARTRKELQQRLVPNKSNPHFFTVKPCSHPKTKTGWTPMTFKTTVKQLLTNTSSTLVTPSCVDMLFTTLEKPFVSITFVNHAGEMPVTKNNRQAITMGDIILLVRAVMRDAQIVETGVEEELLLDDGSCDVHYDAGFTLASGSTGEAQYRLASAEFRRAVAQRGLTITDRFALCHIAADRSGVWTYTS